MQALRDRISSKLSEKSKSKDKDKDGSSSLKTSTSVDGKHTTLSDSHQHQGSLSASAISASASSGNAQPSEKGIQFIFHLFCFLTQGKNKIHMAKRSSMIFSSIYLTFKYLRSLSLQTHL
jgi:hypothetical protein